jgi:putative hemolysin
MLDMFRSKPLHVAFVIDEYGDFLGVVTLTDVLEAIAGEIPEEGASKSDIVRRPDGAWLVAGRAAIEDLVSQLRLEKPEGDFHTAAGLALERLARIPAKGDRFEVDGWTVEVVGMDDKRVDKLLFRPAVKAEAAE